MEGEKFTGMYEVLDALEAVIQAANPDKRRTLAETIDSYAEGPFCEELLWACSGQSPALLYNLMNAIDSACRPEAQSKPRPALRLVDRKSEGSAE